MFKLALCSQGDCCKDYSQEEKHPTCMVCFEPLLQAFRFGCQHKTCVSCCNNLPKHRCYICRLKIVSKQIETYDNPQMCGNCGRYKKEKLKLNCDHTICTPCYDNLPLIQQECPQCRRPIISKTTEQFYVQCSGCANFTPLITECKHKLCYKCNPLTCPAEYCGKLLGTRHIEVGLTTAWKRFVSVRSIPEFQQMTTTYWAGVKLTVEQKRLTEAIVPELDNEEANVLTEIFYTTLENKKNVVISKDVKFIEDKYKTVEILDDPVNDSEGGISKEEDFFGHIVVENSALSTDLQRKYPKKRVVLVFKVKEPEFSERIIVPRTALSADLLTRYSIKRVVLVFNPKKTSRPVRPMVQLENGAAGADPANWAPASIDGPTTPPDCPTTPPDDEVEVHGRISTGGRY